MRPVQTPSASSSTSARRGSCTIPSGATSKACRPLSRCVRARGAGARLCALTWRACAHALQCFYKPLQAYTQSDIGITAKEVEKVRVRVRVAFRRRISRAAQIFKPILALLTVSEAFLSQVRMRCLYGPPPTVVSDIFCDFVRARSGSVRTCCAHARTRRANALGARLEAIRALHQQLQLHAEDDRASDGARNLQHDCRHAGEKPAAQGYARTRARAPHRTAPLTQALELAKQAKACRAC